MRRSATCFQNCSRNPDSSEKGPVVPQGREKSRCRNDAVSHVIGALSKSEVNTGLHVSSKPRISRDCNFGRRFLLFPKERKIPD